MRWHGEGMQGYQNAHDVPPLELLAVMLTPPPLLLALATADADPGYTVISASVAPFSLCAYTCLWVRAS